MTAKFVSKRNLKFLLYEVLDVDHLTSYPYYRQHNRKMFDMVIDEALRLAQTLLRPNMEAMDREPPVLENGRVTVHPAVGQILAECGRGGWIAAGFPTTCDGEQFPSSVTAAFRFIFAAANYSASVYPALCAGAAHLITSFGSPELVQAYVPKMLEGTWQGTMALTEPQAGSSLTDITTSATWDDAGFYRIQGQKIFISAGDHDSAENIVHLMLAKIKGGPPGVKGISLFVVPRLRPTVDRGLVPNDVTVTQVYHKLGYRGAPATELSIGEKNDCHGYLVGEPHRGLPYMFQMMNEARIDVGIGAAAIASAAYYAALDYAAQRPQGRNVTCKDPTLPQVPIIAHADVKRMLLFQRAVVDGALSLLVQCSYYEDLGKVLTGAEKEKYHLLLELLTPIAKSYPSEMGIQAVSQGLQCFGGYGYCEDFPMEQYFRDVRIHAIHEGTTGIQGMDLLGRKVLMHDGRAVTHLLDEVRAVVDSAMTYDDLKAHGAGLTAAVDRLQQTTLSLVALAGAKGPEHFLADATLYLELFGIVVIAWQWLQQAVTARSALERGPSKAESDFYRGKLSTCHYFFQYELPKTLALAQRLAHPDGLTVELEAAAFSD